MKWASTVSSTENVQQAVREVTQTVLSRLQGESPDLLVLFASEHHARSFEQIPQLLGDCAPDALLLGCSAGGVIGGGEELEGVPGLSLTAAVLPDVDIMPIRIRNDLIPAGTAPNDEWEALVHVPAKQDPQFILLPDPLSFEAETFLKGLDQAFPASQKLGGLVSGAQEQEEHALFLGKKCYHDGLVGVALSGNVTVDTLVAQGCRPVGTPMFITRCEGNVLQELDGHSPFEVLRELYGEMDGKDKELFSSALFIGIVMRESLQEYKQGDFLIRNIIGMETSTGSLIIGADLQENTVVQFHLRDAQTSTADLKELLSRYASRPGRASAAGSLLFSCLGRGTSLYGSPNHDTNMLKKYLGELPIGGFFCNGEIGPVHGTTFLHGYTSSFGLFKSRDS